MLRKCHGHNLSKGNIIKIFYHGLSEITQEVLNAAAGGIFLYKIPNPAYQLLEDKVLLKLDWAKNKKNKSSLKKTISFADEGSSNSDTDKIMARMDAMTLKMDAQTFSCNALANLGASINLMPYSLYAKLSLETLKPTKMSLRLADRSFQYPVGIAKNMLVEVGKFTFPADFVILEMEKDSKKQLNLGVGTERKIFNINSAMKHSYSNDDTCFSIDVIDKILEEDLDVLLDEGSKILHYIEGTLLEEEIFTELNKFMEMTADEISDS
uniref:Reverse transcriptase domain-containing protein n=1 Tax=Tanacetum cinerariifolium TaxID=118510 RepID=A0A699JF80_TANCI|nr:reverse transcriptase domain-containing protein [Tanacetum cinerariifolium]